MNSPAGEIQPGRSGVPKRFWINAAACVLVLVGSFCGTPGAGAAEAAASVRPWRDYRTILWIGDSAGKQPEKRGVFVQRLREMGINTAMVYGDGDPQPWVDAGFPYYVENVVNRGLCLKFHSQVSDWDKMVTEWAKAGRPKEKLARDYCLDDPEWRSWARKEMQRAARKNALHFPLAYDIRDELSTTISANPFDYDFSPGALDGFRTWLRTQYGDLDALNIQWETRFTQWSEVVPFTTDEIKNRMATGEAIPSGKPDWGAVAAVRFEWPKVREKATAWNFSPWADFRSYMDLSLARTLSDLRQATREVDPHTPVGIEGTQMPHAFGGYDLWRLSEALDWVEPYDIGNAREIFGSFMPHKTLLTTVFETETKQASRRLWHLLLEGDRGCIIWWSEDCIDWGSDDLRLTAKAKALAPVLAEMTSPLATLFLRAERVRDPVYLHYSQASIQADWLIESTVDGSTWLRRFSSFEAEHNQQAKVRNSWVKLLQDVGYSPVFVSTDQIESGILSRQTNAAVVLPSSWAVSAREAAELVGLTTKGGALLWNGTPGFFDGRARLRKNSPFEKLCPESFSERKVCVAVSGGNAHVLPGNIAEYAEDRLKGRARHLTDWARKQVGREPAVAIDPSLAVRTQRYRVGDVELLGFERNITYEMSEALEQAGGNEPLEKAVRVEAGLARAGYVYDLRLEKLVGHTNRLTFTLDPWRPSLYAVSPVELPENGLVKRLLEAQ